MKLENSEKIVRRYFGLRNVSALGWWQKRIRRLFSKEMARRVLKVGECVDYHPSENWDSEQEILSTSSLVKRQLFNFFKRKNKLYLFAIYSN